MCETSVSNYLVFLVLCNVPFQFDDDSPVMTNNGNIFVPKKNYGREDSNFDGLPKSPSGRLTKYFSGKRLFCKLCKLCKYK